MKRHSAQPRNLSMEGLRGLLASAVVAYHIHRIGVKAGFYAPSNHVVVETLGTYAVCIFFCVSGFLISSTLVAKRDVKEFLWNRLARIYPVFMILHLILFTAGPLADYAWMGRLRSNAGLYAAHFTSNLLFLPGVFDLPIAQKNAWSLSFEMAFYLIAAAFYWSGVRWCSSASLFVFLAALAASAAILYQHPNALFFLVGIAAYWLDSSGVKRAPNIVVSLFALSAGLWSFSHFLPLSIGCTFVFFWACVRNSGLLARALSIPALAWLGTTSYSLYLVHPFALDPVRAALIRVPGIPPGVLFAVVGPICAVALSALSYGLIEKKLTRALLAPSRRRLKEVCGDDGSLTAAPIATSRATVGVQS